MNMTREEQIEKAVEEFSECFAKGWMFNDVIEDAYRKGAQWADQHPVNPWHDASKELPKENGKYLVKAFNGYLCALRFIDGGWNTFGYQSDIKYWMPIPEIEKED